MIAKLRAALARLMGKPPAPVADPLFAQVYTAPVVQALEPTPLCHRCVQQTTLYHTDSVS